MNTSTEISHTAVTEHPHVTQCCIAGGGPAGMMLGFLLARAGVEVIVLEKHADFLRDFRGDTIHPSTLELMHELGLLDDFLARPHQETREIAAQFGDEEVVLADFSRLSTRCRFLAFMPQWDFLDFLAEHARRYPAFHLRMRTEAVGLLEEGGHIAGVRCKGPEGAFDIRAKLVIGADGRHSTVRQAAQMAVEELGAPIDVLWLRLSRQASDPQHAFGRVAQGKFLVMIDRGDYWQCGYVIPKGDFDAIRQRGLPAFRAELASVAAFAADRMNELRDWDDIKLLTVSVNHLRTWYRTGLLCIGDAAHAMSPVGGVGINLAIQDAVAAANILATPLRAGTLDTGHLKAVQHRREFPARLIQRVQLFVQDRIIGKILGGHRSGLPWPLRILRRWPALRRIPAYLIGVGIRPEHIKTADVWKRSNGPR